MIRSFMTMLFSFLLLAACGQTVISDPNAQVRNVGSFHGIKVATGIRLVLTQGTEQKVVVSASDAKYRDRIHTVVENGILKIYYDHLGISFSDRPTALRAYVSCTDIDLLDASSGSEVKVDGQLKTGKLNIDVSSGARFEGKVDADALSVQSSSGARAALSGQAGSIKGDASSGASIRAFDLTVNKCMADVSSGGHLDITVQKELVASAHSGGHISYKGSGVITDVSTGSGGGVSRN